MKTKMNWKRICCLALGISMLGTATPALALTDEEKEAISDNWGFYPYNLNWTTGDLVVTGYFYNNNEAYDVLQIEDVDLSLYQADGTELFSWDFSGDENIANMVIPADGMVDWVFTISNLSDASIDTLRTANLDDGFFCDLSAAYSFIECDGKLGCETCEVWRGLFEGTDVGYELCPACNGERICNICDGEGYYTSKGALKICPLCDGEGICQECEGLGWVEQ